MIGFRDTNDFVNLGICKHEFKFTCRGYCKFTVSGVPVRNTGFIPIKIILLIFLFSPVCSRQLLFCRLSKVEGGGGGGGGVVSLFVIE